MSDAAYLDTNIFIKGFEADDAEADYAWAILEAIASNEMRAVTSELTLAEVLPKPLTLHESDLVESYQSYLQTGRGLTVAPITRDVLVATGRLRAANPLLRLADAIHIATALHATCPVFLSNDRRIRGFVEMKVIRLGPTSLDEIRKLNA